MQAQAAGARRPVRSPMPWPRSPGSSCQVCAAVGRAEQRGVLDAGVDRVGIGQRRLEVPDALELPRMRRAVVPLVRAGHAVVDELVARRLPRLAAVVRPLDDLPEPAARLRRVDAVRVGRRSLEVVDLPAAEMRPADVPLSARLPSDVRMNAPFACPNSTRPRSSWFSFLISSPLSLLYSRSTGAGIRQRLLPPKGGRLREINSLVGLPPSGGSTASALQVPLGNPSLHCTKDAPEAKNHRIDVMRSSAPGRLRLVDGTALSPGERRAAC